MATPHDPGPPERDELPDLPPGWGRVVIPDDASALAEEAALLRRELREHGHAGRTPRSGHPGPLRPARPDPRPSGRLPLLVIVLAVLATAAGVLAVTWPRPDDLAGPPPVVPVGSAEPAPGRTLPALELTDQTQEPVSVRRLLPAVILLVDGCTCTEQISATAAAVPPGVNVLTVVSDGAVPPPASTGVRSLGDPAGGLRAFLQLPDRPGTATAVLVDRTGTVVRVVPEVRSVEDYRADLTRLGQR